jgi:hypothetical protein
MTFLFIILIIAVTLIVFLNSYQKSVQKFAAEEEKKFEKQKIDFQKKKKRH